ncbi:hypothetical protein RHMOL_Rhmol08G0153500 [Rhododendron molle]|uniref:Uncharacterized protein n=1 Tax=Rhododendron molle TaxID=49168 RepID=A0ACC0MP16_RHOML|nr:hypothetical protein RHMOL_Rhmol08G0153500 [Rhododendron molle]
MADHGDGGGGEKVVDRLEDRGGEVVDRPEDRGGPMESQIGDQMVTEEVTGTSAVEAGGGDGREDRQQEINVMRLMEWYGHEGDNGDMALQARRWFALVISVLAAYLLVSPTGQINPSLVSVAAQLGDRRNMVSMVLAETLIGLDLVASGQTMIFGGCPLLLQLWLSDKLGLIAAPEANWPRLPGRMHQREMLYLKMSTKEWIRFMNEQSPEEITWRHEVLDIPDMAVKSAGYDQVVIAGLSSFTFYIPGRILRQLGISQGSHRAGAESFHVPAFTAQNLIGLTRVLNSLPSRSMS